ncbi:MAG: serine hydrolase domain-containing protein [Algoriphagus sp.]|uniref:serine hydrolase domain-containing protein n=1 Tax=Algoriphagus sp. TaxID=1872435 RepID=UPI00272F7198|nr:serine hydrolase domain-containing protein [Algoriphagus sp.]MDP2040416.1 serine hydrolase domain-containing protein [Algoriphagus sp.]MDP3471896.1 serine hydrolase domain-containing protein [Algoriphagus sp.]
MKTNPIYCVALLLLIFIDFEAFSQEKKECNPTNTPAETERFASVQKKLHELVKLGVPGVVGGVKSGDLSWYSAAGFFRLEDKSPMKTCNLQYLQSISKTYLATSILQLKDQGKIDLDQPVSTYLPAELAAWIVQSDGMTVRMLLNHTSGIPEYNYLPEYISVLLQDPDHPFTPMDYMELIKGKRPDFEPGSKYSYRNSGYVLLALMMDHLTGDHARFIRKNIFEKVGLKNTFYRESPDYLEKAELVDGYWDRHSNSILENSSFLQKQNVKKLIGDDGIITTAEDAIHFLKELVEGRLISPKSLSEMKTWANDAKGNPQYGLGLDLTILGGKEAIGHSGGGLGAGSQLYYFPVEKVYVFLAINLATVTGSPMHIQAEKVINELYLEILNQSQNEIHLRIIAD